MSLHTVTKYRRMAETKNYFYVFAIRIVCTYIDVQSAFSIWKEKKKKIKWEIDRKWKCCSDGSSVHSFSLRFCCLCVSSAWEKNRFLLNFNSFYSLLVTESRTATHEPFAFLPRQFACFVCGYWVWVWVFRRDSPAASIVMYTATTQSHTINIRWVSWTHTQDTQPEMVLDVIWIHIMLCIDNRHGTLVASPCSCVRKIRKQQQNNDR